jgi:hypothetical protein
MKEQLLLIRRGRHPGVNRPQKPGLLRKLPQRNSRASPIEEIYNSPEESESFAAAGFYGG